MTQLSPHFSLEEMTRSATAQSLGESNQPNESELANLTKLCAVLEKVRVILSNKPIAISSGFRNQRVNQAVGGVWNSAHLTGEAADFSCPAFGSVVEVARAIAPHVRELGIDQLINEYGGWVHLGIRNNPRNAVFTLNSTGYHEGIV